MKIVIFDHSGLGMAQFFKPAPDLPSGVTWLNPVLIPPDAPRRPTEDRQIEIGAALAAEDAQLFACHVGNYSRTWTFLVDKVHRDQVAVELSSSPGLGNAFITPNGGLHVRAPKAFDDLATSPGLVLWLLWVWDARAILYRYAATEALTVEEEHRLERLGFACKRQIGEALTILCRGVLVAWAASDLTLRPSVVAALELPPEAATKLFDSIEGDPSDWKARLDTVQKQQWWASVFSGEAGAVGEWKRSLQGEFERRKAPFADPVKRLTQWIANDSAEPLRFEEILPCYRILNGIFGKPRSTTSQAR